MDKYEGSTTSWGCRSTITSAFNAASTTTTTTTTTTRVTREREGGRSDEAAREFLQSASPTNSFLSTARNEVTLTSTAEATAGSEVASTSAGATTAAVDTPPAAGWGGTLGAAGGERAAAEGMSTRAATAVASAATGAPTEPVTPPANAGATAVREGASETITTPAPAGGATSSAEAIAAKGLAAAQILTASRGGAIQNESPGVAHSVQEKMVETAGPAAYGREEKGLHRQTLLALINHVFAEDVKQAKEQKAGESTMIAIPDVSGQANNNSIMSVNGEPSIAKAPGNTGISSIELERREVINKREGQEAASDEDAYEDVDDYTNSDEEGCTQQKQRLKRSSASSSSTSSRRRRRRGVHGKRGEKGTILSYSRAETVKQTNINSEKRKPHIVSDTKKCESTITAAVPFAAGSLITSPLSTWLYPSRCEGGSSSSSQTRLSLLQGRGVGAAGGGAGSCSRFTRDSSRENDSSRFIQKSSKTDSNIYSMDRGITNKRRNTDGVSDIDSYLSNNSRQNGGASGRNSIDRSKKYNKTFFQQSNSRSSTCSGELTFGKSLDDWSRNSEGNDIFLYRENAALNEGWVGDCRVFDEMADEWEDELLEQAYSDIFNEELESLPWLFSRDDAAESLLMKDMQSHKDRPSGLQGAATRSSGIFPTTSGDKGKAPTAKATAVRATAAAGSATASTTNAGGAVARKKTPATEPPTLLEYVVNHMIYSLGVRQWSSFFGLQAELWLPAQEYRLALMAAAAAERFMLADSSSTDEASHVSTEERSCAPAAAGQEKEQREGKKEAAAAVIDAPQQQKHRNAIKAPAQQSEKLTAAKKVQYKTTAALAAVKMTAASARDDFITCDYYRRELQRRGSDGFGGLSETLQEFVAASMQHLVTAASFNPGATTSYSPAK